MIFFSLTSFECMFILFVLCVFVSNFHEHYCRDLHDIFTRCGCWPGLDCPIGILGKGPGANAALGPTQKAQTKKKADEIECFFRLFLVSRCYGFGSVWLGGGCLERVEEDDRQKLMSTRVLGFHKWSSFITLN